MAKRRQYYVKIASIDINYEPGRMTLTELKYILAVAAERHFGRAARRCFVSQPSLSAAVKKLEDELGVLIFERGKNDILVTETGAQVIAQARRVMDEVERVKEVAGQGRNPLAGVFRLGIIHTVAPYLLPDLVAELRKVAPQMPLDIEENITANLELMLKGGMIDAAILSLPFESQGIDVIPLYDEEFRVIVPAGHPWARRRTVRTDDLATQNLLLLSIGHCFRDQVLDACHEFAHTPAAGKQGNSLETIRNMVASGMGVSVLPASALTPKYANRMIKPLDFSEPKPARRIVLVRRQGFPRNAAIEAIAGVIAKLDLPIKPFT